MEVQTITGGFDQDAFPYLELQVLNKAKNLSATVKAIIDTGAAHCMIQEELARQLELETLRTADYRHPVLGKMPLLEYLMDICFFKNEHCIASMDGVRAGTLVDTQYPASIILGVEVLKHCTFIYNGWQRTFTLGFKS